MRRFLLTAVLLAGLTGPAHASLDEESLDELFDRLRLAPSAEVAEPYTQAIFRLWSLSDSPTVEVLLGAADDAITQGDRDKAIELLDTLIEFRADVAEAYNKRATAYFLVGDMITAVRDIESTLALEPRHFGALAGLGTIMERLGEKAKALDAWRRAVAINPHIRGGKERVRELEVEVRGRAI